MTVFMTTEEVKSSLHKSDFFVIDCRNTLNDPNAGYKEYLTGHIPGAFYADLERDLSGMVRNHGGRHPLPDPDYFRGFIERAGIHANAQVLIYDEFGEMAARLWWLFKYFRYGNPSILHGGWNEWVASGEEITTGEAQLHMESIQVDFQINEEMILSRDTLMARIEQEEQDYHLVDSRAMPRYLGEVEPIDPVAGHIPTAVCYFWKDSLEKDGKWLDADALRSHFSELLDGREIILYCGSGVSACVNAVALWQIGVKATLYPGSWSDWCSYEDAPIAL